MTIRVENLCFRYKTLGASPGNVLEDVSFEIPAGEFTALLGSSGSGKTTLMQHLTGLLKPDSGRVLLDGQDLWKDRLSLTAVRRRIGLVFQFPESQLFEESVFADVAFGPRNVDVSQPKVAERVHMALESVALDFERFRNRNPIHLSEGEKRRVAIAGVLAMQPECLVLDEPTAGLDQGGVEAVMTALGAYHAERRSVILISHNLDLVASAVKRVVVLQEGRVKFDGASFDLFQDAELIRSCGLRPPRILSVILELKRRHLLSPDGISSLNELKEALRHSITNQSNLAPSTET